RQRGILFLLLVPLALGSLNNGQPNLLLAGLLLAAVAAAAHGRWALCAACVALATAVKVYPLALGLLLAAAYPRRLGGRRPLALALLAGLPFLLQEPGYVARQYGLWLARVATTDEARRYWPAAMAYRDLWLLLRLAHVPVPLGAYQALQLAAGGGRAGLGVAPRRPGLAPPARPGPAPAPGR